MQRISTTGFHKDYSKYYLWDIYYTGCLPFTWTHFDILLHMSKETNRLMERVLSRSIFSLSVCMFFLPKSLYIKNFKRENHDTCYYRYCNKFINAITVEYVSSFPSENGGSSKF